MISGRLTMRAQVERDQAAGRDGWGQKNAAAFAPIGEPLPCFIWSPSGRELVSNDRSAQLLELRGLFAIGADLNENDELASVTDRAGNVIVAGRLRVNGPVQFKHNHLEAALERIG